MTKRASVILTKVSYWFLDGKFSATGIDRSALPGATLATVSHLAGKSPPSGCATASHLHTENAAGGYNSSDYAGKSVTGRYSDARYLYLSGID